MSKLRNNIIQALPKNLAQACKEETLDWGENNFFEYIIERGIGHLFQISDLEAIPERLPNLYF